LILLGRVILGIFTEVTFVTRISDLLTQMWAFNGSQMVQFLLQFAQPLFGVIRCGTHASVA
jgi:hypothetical protein